MTSANELAKYIIYLIKRQSEGVQPEEFDITPLKLQKLLYYCQGYALGLTGKPIFPEAIEAWRYGPVIESVYQEYKKYEKGIIPLECDRIELSDETIESIAYLVVKEKGKKSGIALAQATHKERPYKESYEGAYRNAEISQKSLKEYFSEKFVEWETSEDEDDEIWEKAGKTVSRERLEAALAEI